MRVDRYQPCPCGSGKKIKFCCSKDIADDLARVMRMSEGEQRQAALDSLKGLLQKHPNLPSLLSIKATVQMQLGQLKEARQTVDQFLDVASESPVANAQHAILCVAQRDSDAAVKALQDALDLSGDELALPVYDAMGIVARLLVSEGKIIAARGHYLMQAAAAGEDDPGPITALLQINQSPEISLLLKDDPKLAPAPESAPWKGEFDEAVEHYERGVWSAACEGFKELAGKASSEPCIWENIALLEGMLGNTNSAVTAYSRFAHLDGVPLERAVEAEATAQELNPFSDRKLDILQVTYEVSDADRLMENLLSDRRAASMGIDPLALAAKDAPPPKGAFWLLDKPLVESSDALQRPDISQVIAELLLFGKQTDHSARVEVALTRGQQFQNNLDSALAILGDLVGEAKHERVVGQTSDMMDTLSVRWHLPPDLTAADRKRLIEEEIRDSIFHRWTKHPWPMLDDRTPEQAAEDPYAQIRLLAAVLNLELLAEERSWNFFDANDLRRQLGLPTLGTIEPDGIKVTDLPLVRLHRLTVEKLQPEDLITLFGRATMKSARRALIRFSNEVIRRDDLPENVDRARAYAALARHATTLEEALSYYERATREARSHNRSPAMYLLSEMDVRIRLGQSTLVQNLIERIQREHGREPGVQETLIRILAKYGLIRPDGLPKGQHEISMEPDDLTVPAMGETEEAATSPGGIWTPGANVAAAESTKAKESKIWIPGSE